MENISSPKVFISYSWTTPDHEQWVIDLATELRESGVEAVLDKWDLKQGHDAIAFMEGMVTDPSIKKVIMIVDRYYAEKANARTGGVGTEAQIISKELYGKIQQDKFVAVVVEKDDEGKLCSPVYCSSRIHIDFTDSEKYQEKLEELLRWIFDKPRYVKPSLGKIPTFILDDNPTKISTSIYVRRALDSIKNAKLNSIGSFNEYLDTLQSELEKFRINPDSVEFDDFVIQSINDFLPYRNEFITLILALANYTNDIQFSLQIHKFFERLIPYLHRPENVNTFREIDWDNFRFIIHELFLFVIAIFLKYEKFDYVSTLLQEQYFVSKGEDNNRMTLYTEFRQPVRSLSEIRNHRLKLQRASVQADLLKQRAEQSGLEFRYIMQADFLLFIRAELEAINDPEGYYKNWWPVTLLYAGRYYDNAFEIFLRAESKRYFEKIKGILGISKLSDLEPLFKLFRENGRRVPAWDFVRLNPSALIGYEKLATRP